MIRDLFPEPDIDCKTLKTEQRGAVSWVLEWIANRAGPSSVNGTEVFEN